MSRGNSETETATETEKGNSKRALLSGEERLLGHSGKLKGENWVRVLQIFDFIIR